MWTLSKFSTVSPLTSFRGMASAHLEKEFVAAKMNMCPWDDGGLIGPMTFMPHASKCREIPVGCRGSGGCMIKSACILHTWHLLENYIASFIIEGQKSPKCLNWWYNLGPDWCAPQRPECASSKASLDSSSERHLNRIGSHRRIADIKCHWHIRI